MHESVQVIDSVQLIPLDSGDISPLISKVKIKVFYLGTNRNNSYIDKPTALNMSKTLRGSCIVGEYKIEKQDFSDHGKEVTINSDGIKIERKTVPYGFVDLNSDIWFEDYIESDEFGNAVQRTYVVTNGYVWTGRYPELDVLLHGAGRPQSMELDEKTLDGYWTKKDNESAKIFIINDAIFSGLCILGEDVEPCFEGSSLSAQVDSNFSLTQEFTQTFCDMLKQFKEFTFSKKEGGNSMGVVKETETVVAPDVTSSSIVENTLEENATPAVDSSTVVEEKVAEEPTVEVKSAEEFTQTQDPQPEEEFKKADEKEDEKEESSDESGKEEEDEDEEKKKKADNTLNEYTALAVEYTKLQNEYAKLKADYSALESENKELKDFKASVEDEKKVELINSFYMLSDEDKKDVIENKAQYSLDDIEAKLSIICVRKKVNFNLENKVEEQKEEQPPLTFTLNSVDVDAGIPAWIKAVDSYKKNSQEI